MISVAIMAHPKRKRFVAQLTEQLDAEVVWDQRNNRRDTGRRAWRAHDPKATHHVVLQDDAVPCQDLIAGITELVKHTGDQPVSLFYCRTGPRMLPIDLIGRLANQGKYSGVDLEVLYTGVGLVLPTSHIRDMLAWTDRQKHAAYDMPIWRYYQRRKMNVRYTWPSLIDHRELSESRSIITRADTPGRVAYNFIGADRSALDVDWTLPVLDAAAAVKAECGVPMFTWRHRETGQLLTLDSRDRRLRRRPPSGAWERADR